MTTNERKQVFPANAPKWSPSSAYGGAGIPMIAQGWPSARVSDPRFPRCGRSGVSDCVVRRGRSTRCIHLNVSQEAVSGSSPTAIPRAIREITAACQIANSSKNPRCLSILASSIRVPSTPASRIVVVQKSKRRNRWFAIETPKTVTKPPTSPPTMPLIPARNGMSRASSRSGGVSSLSAFSLSDAASPRACASVSCFCAPEAGSALVEIGGGFL